MTKIINKGNFRIRKIFFAVAVIFLIAGVSSIFFLKSDGYATLPGKIAFGSGKFGQKTMDVAVLQNGKALPIAKAAGHPRWSPDGQKLLYTLMTDKEKNLVVWDSTTNEKQNYKLEPGPLQPVWVDDQRIIYLSIVKGGVPVDQRILGLFLFDFASGKVTKLHEFAPGDFIHTGLDVSSDQKKIIFIKSSNQKKGYGIYIADLMKGGVQDIKEIGYGLGTRFSPDGKKIVFHRKVDPFKGDKKDHFQIFILNLETGEEKQLTGNRWRNSQPTWSPDGKQICFVSYRHDSPMSGSELFVMNADGTGEKRITPPQKHEYNRPPFFSWTTDDQPDWAV